MKKKEYFIIKPTEDGAKIYNMDKNSLRTFLNEQPDGWEFSSDLEKLGTDPNYWGYTMLIIKGSIIKPEPVEVVKEYKFD